MCTVENKNFTGTEDEQFSTGQILTHFKMDICERLSHRMHHSTAMTT